MGGENSLSAVPMERGLEFSHRLRPVGSGELSAQRHKVSLAGKTFREPFNPHAVRETDQEEMNRRRSRAVPSRGS